MRMPVARRREWTHSSKATTALQPRCYDSRQAVYSGPAQGVAEWLDGYARAGATDLILRFAGEHERHLEILAQVRAKLGW